MNLASLLHGKTGSFNVPWKDGDDLDVVARMMRDGSLSVASWLQALALEGRVYGVNFGSQTTPLTIVSLFAQLQPDGVLRIPDGTVVIPIAMHVSLEVSSGTVNELSITMTQNDIGNGTSSAATREPVNLRSDARRTSNCVARQLYTADSSAFTNALELFRFGQELATAAGAFAPGTISWAPEVKPVLVGPASLVLSLESTTTAIQFFGQLIYAELDKSYV